MGSRTKKILENAKKINEENSAGQTNINTTIDIENAEIIFEEDLNHAINNETVTDALNQVYSQPENDLHQVFNDLEKNSFQNNSTINNVNLSPRQNHHSCSENKEEYIPDTNIESSDECDNIDDGEDIQSNNENVEPEATKADENAEEYLQKRKRGKTNQRQLNKRLRIQGQNYLGFRKPRNQRKTFNDTERTKRRLKPR